MGNEFNGMKPKQIVQKMYTKMENNDDFHVLNAIIALQNALISELYYKPDVYPSGA